MLFKVTTFSTNGKPMCSFLLVRSTDLHPILHHFQLIADYWSNFPYLPGVPLFNTFIRSEPMNSAL